MPRLGTGLTRLLFRQLPEDIMVSVAPPYAADDLSDPEPDLAVVPYRSSDQDADKAHLVIGVSHSSRRKDLGVKARTYAISGVPEYWVVAFVHVHTDRWARLDPHRPGRRRHAHEVAGVRAVLADLLGTG